MKRPPPRSTLFPYPPLFRSLGGSSGSSPGDPVALGPAGLPVVDADGAPATSAPAEPSTISAPSTLAPTTAAPTPEVPQTVVAPDRKSTRLNSSHANISYAVF